MGRKLTAAQKKLTPEELRKDVLARSAEALLKQIDPKFQIQWVKSSKPPKLGFRKVIQMEG